MDKRTSDAIKELVSLILSLIIELTSYGLFIMVLWNLVIPSIFQGAPSINYGQAIGLFGLSRLLIRPIVQKD